MQKFKRRFEGPPAALPGLPEWERALLTARGIDTAEKAEKFLHPRLEDLHDPLRMRDMDKALTIIRMAIRRQDPILVYGDYDVDGISAVTVLLETLREEGAKADFRIPGRHTEGYGLNEQAVREIAEKYRLLITVDCGIANGKEVRLAKSLGMNVIVTDHHEIPEELPPADAVLDPLLGDYPFRRLCGAGVALKITQALQGMAGVEKRLEIAALATVADVVPLVDENRIIVREGMLRMARTGRPGLQALIENAKVSFPMRADDIAFRLGPRLNAAGRLEDAAQGVRLLMTEDPAEAKTIADHLEENNRIRQETEQRIIQEALDCLPRQVNLRKDRILILEGEDWNTGLIGLAAGKLCEKYHHPVIVLSRQEDRAVGSCRSIPGVNIWEELNRCGDLFLRFGGHAQAAGLTIPVENIPALRERLNRALREEKADERFLPVVEYDSELPLEEVTLDMIAALEALEPVGCGNPAPVFRCRNASVQSMRRVGRDQSHLKLSLLSGKTLLDGIGFGLGEAVDQGYRRVDVLFRPDRNEFMGRVTPQMQVQALSPAEEDGEEAADGNPEQFFLDCMQEMSRLSEKPKEETQALPGLRPEHLLKERLDAVHPAREALLDLYLEMRKQPPKTWEEVRAAAGSGEQALFALTVFDQLGLLRWQREPFQLELIPAKSDLSRSPLYRYMTGL